MNKKLSDEDLEKIFAAIDLLQSYDLDTTSVTMSITFELDEQLDEQQ